MPNVVKIAFKAVIAIAGLVYLLWHFAPWELIEKQRSLELGPGPNREIFRILSGTERFPKFTLAVIDQRDVNPGDIQKLTVLAEDSNSITEIIALTKLDQNILTLPLNLVSGTKVAGYWTNAWVIRETPERIYRTKFVAKNRLGQTNTITFAWSDNCALPASGDWIVNSNCSIFSAAKVNQGNINLGNYTITLGPGASLTYHKGFSINLSAGFIAIADTARIRQTDP
jgi:hypothetical protein